MKVGIITFYNGNINYGGILQAYALQHAIEKLGCECKQICIDNTITENLSIFKKVKLILQLRGKVVPIYLRKREQGKREQALEDVRMKQIDGFKRFERSIPHTKKCYKVHEMHELNDLFDVFVVGSDQVWTPMSGGFRPVPHKWSYYLDFATKRKISYGASFGTDRIPEEYQDEIIPRIRALDAISVREEYARKILVGKVKKDITVVVDPVLLLSKDKWGRLACNPKESNYSFAYILGNQQESREIARYVAGKKSRQLITIPFIGDYIKEDRSFGDVTCIGSTPEEFLGYIKNADVIITDSFHCAVFSIIFDKNFVVLRRSVDSSKGSMNARLVNLLQMFGIEKRIAKDQSEVLEIINETIDYAYIKKQICFEVNKSISWLSKCLRFD